MNALAETLMDHMPAINGPVESFVVFALGAVMLAIGVWLMSDSNKVIDVALAVDEPHEHKGDGE